MLKTGDLKKEFLGKTNEKFGLNQKMYKVLEVIFRQSMICSDFEYNIESKNLELFNKNLTDGDRLQEILKHINNINSKNYGSEEILVNELKENNLIANEINVLLAEFQKIKNKHKLKYLSNDILKKCEELITEEFEKALKTSNDLKYGYVKFNKKLNEFECIEQKYDYFSKYIYLSAAIFDKPLDLVTFGDKNKLSVFIQEKLVAEHSINLPWVETAFTKSIVKDRIRKNEKRVLDERDNLINIGLISEDFFGFLINKYN